MSFNVPRSFSAAPPQQTWKALYKHKGQYPSAMGTPGVCTTISSHVTCLQMHSLLPSAKTWYGWFAWKGAGLSTLPC